MKVILIFISIIASYQGLDANESLSSIFSQKIPSDIEKVKVNEMDILNLLNASFSNTSDRRSIADVFKKHYGQHQIEITHFWDENHQYVINGRVLSIDHELAEPFFEAFGSFVERVRISYTAIPIRYHKIIGKIVNTHCADTLFEFHAYICPDGALSEMRRPFKSVESVIYHGEWWNLGGLSLNFNELFPKMRRLNLTYTGQHLFDYRYPNLVELIANKPTSDDFVKIMDKNPQIFTLKINETSMEFLRILNKKLPELKVLAFTIPMRIKFFAGPTIQFEHVEELSILDKDQNMKTIGFAFKQLKKLEVYVEGLICDEWIAFIGNNTDLERLIITNGTINDTAIVKLSEKLGHLTEMEICNCDCNANSIEMLISSNEQMKSMVFRNRVGSEEFLKNLTNTLSQEWNVVRLDNNYFSISQSSFTSLGETPVDHEETEVIPASRSSSIIISNDITIFTTIIILLMTSISPNLCGLNEDQLL